MKKTIVLLVYGLSVFLSSFMLAGCGGSSSGSGGYGLQTVSGVAATGAPISGVASLKDAAGTEKSTLINSDGTFSIVVNGLKAPFILKAEWTPAGGVRQALYSFASSAGRANITPFSNLVVCSASGGADISVLYAAPNASLLQMLTATVPAAVIALRSGPLKPLLDQYANIDPIKGAFMANHTGFDRLLDDVTIAIEPIGTVTVSNSGTGATIFAGSTSNLGFGTFSPENMPPVPLPGDMSSPATMKISAGYYHAMALKTDGTVWAWGGNADGQLGDGTTIDQLTPVQVKGLNHIIDISVGDNISTALRDDGTVYIWGRDQRITSSGGSFTPIKSPVLINGITNVKAIANGHGHWVALKQDGTVWWWGRYISSSSAKSVPTQVAGLSNVASISSEFALKTDNTLWNLNLGSTAALSVAGVSGVSSLMQHGTAIEGGYNQYAKKTDGSIWKLWGTPAQVSSLPELTAISGKVGDWDTTAIVALKSDGTAWDLATDGSLATQIGTLTEITAISAGMGFTFALKSDGTIWGWGSNSNGVLGDGTTTDQSTSVQVNGIDLN